MQLDIRAQTTGSKETRQRLINRTNTKYETVTLTNGRKLTGRNPNIPFKPPRKKPENGASIKEHEPGKMLKAIRIMDRQYGGKLIRYFYNSFGYQLRLAEANRKMQELTLPELRPTKRVKANPKKGLPERISIDPRTRDAHSSNRRFQRGFNAIDQNLLPLLGPFPVIPQQDIIQVDISGTTSDEERNIAAHPQNWMGREIPNPPEDTAKLLVNILNFLMPPPNLGDMPGDATRFDKKGNLIIVKEELKTSSSEDEPGIINDSIQLNDSTQEIRNTSGCNCRCHTTPNANEGGGDNNPVPEIYGEGEPIPSTTTGITHAPEIAEQSHLSIPGHLEISGEALANMFNEFFRELNVSITPKEANIAGKWIFDGRVNRTQMITDQEPVTSDQDQVVDQVPNQDLIRIGGKSNPEYRRT